MKREASLFSRHLKMKVSKDTSDEGLHEVSDDSQTAGILEFLCNIKQRLRVWVSVPNRHELESQLYHLLTMHL